MRPEARICLYVSFVVSLFFFKDLALYASLIALLSLLLVIRVPFAILKMGWVPISILLTFTFISNLLFQEGKVLFHASSFVVTDEGIHAATLRTMRFFLMIAGAKMLTSTTTPESLVTALGRLLGPLRKLHIPIDDFLQIVGFTMKSLPRLKQEIVSGCREKVPTGHDVGLSERVRLISSQVIPVFVRSMQIPERHFEEGIGARRDPAECERPASKTNSGH